MVFSSAVFLFLFLPLTLIIYALTPKRAKSYFILLASAIFYFWGSKALILLLIASIVWNYFSALLIDRARDRKSCFPVLCVAIAGNLALLFYFKYFNFFMESTNGLLSYFGSSAIHFKHVALPIGISFFTFQAISYVVDVYRGDVVVQKNIFLLALFKFFFPQLIAGPIVRYSDVEKHLSQSTTTLALFSEGVNRFVIGLAKKVVLADGFAEVAKRVLDLPANEISIGAAWIGIAAYAMQIFFDFSGYSDMAIGMGKMFGYHFPENFNYPYSARSIKDFWRRWHMSLSTWFRDYLFIPLGGSQGGTLKTYRNLFIVFIFCGLWHGASWNFLVWGLIHGSFLAIERTAFGRMLEKLPGLLQHCYTLFVVLIAWVFFRIENLGDAVRYLGRMFGLVPQLHETISAGALLNPEIVILCCLAVCGSFPFIEWVRTRSHVRLSFFRPLAHVSYSVLLMGILIYSAARLSAQSYSPFIYFRF